MRAGDGSLCRALTFLRNACRPFLRPLDRRLPRRVAWRQQSHTEPLPVLFARIAWGQAPGRIERTRNRHEQNEAGYKRYSRHGRSMSLLDAVRYDELANALLVASRTCHVRPLLLDGLVPDLKLRVARVSGAACKNYALEGLWKVASILKHSHKNALRAPSSAA